MHQCSKGLRGMQRRKAGLRSAERYEARHRGQVLPASHANFRDLQQESAGFRSRASVRVFQQDADARFLLDGEFHHQVMAQLPETRATRISSRPFSTTKSFAWMAAIRSPNRASDSPMIRSCSW